MEAKPRRSLLHALCLRIGALSLGVLGVILVLEIVLRFLPVIEVTGLSPVNAENPVLHLAPNRCTTRSKGPRLNLVTEVCANNDGFRNHQDYELDNSSPLLAFVGDSYVVAATVPYEQTSAFRLSDTVGDRGRVYSFGVRGAAFPQYLVWASHARDSFRPDAFCFLIIANDFAGSLRPGAGYHHFVRNEDDTSEIVRTDSTISLAQKVSTHSALLRYLILNCQINQKPWKQSAGPPSTVLERFVGNIAAQTTEKNMERYRWAFRSFLERLPEATGVGTDRILLLVDGMRPHMYDAERLAFAETSAWGELRRYVVETARARGYEVADLHPRFLEEFDEHGRRFESPHDNHWDGNGHRVAAEEIARSSVFQELFSR